MKIVERLLSFIFLLFLLGVFPVQVFADSEIQNIESFEDLNQLVNDPQMALDVQKNLAFENKMEAEIEPISAKKAKIIIAGDSWAVFPCVFGSMRKMLRENNYPLLSDRRCLSTSKLGIRADEWLDSNQDKRLMKYLKKDRRIKYIYLSLGGNDMMKYWRTTFTPENDQELYQKISEVIQKIIFKYKALRPDVKIIISGYDYGRLTDQNLIPLYTEIFNRMLQPSPQQVNNQLIHFSNAVSRLADGRQIFYIHHLGLAHYYDGVPELGLDAGQTMKPDDIAAWDHPSTVGGDPTLPNSRKSMINWLGLTQDAIHLSNRNYYHVMQHTYNNLLKYILHKPTSEKLSEDHEILQN